jgi:hypothetical protein
MIRSWRDGNELTRDRSRSTIHGFASIASVRTEERSSMVTRVAQHIVGVARHATLRAHNTQFRGQLSAIFA